MGIAWKCGPISAANCGQFSMRSDHWNLLWRGTDRVLTPCAGSTIDLAMNRISKLYTNILDNS